WSYYTGTTNLVCSFTHHTATTQSYPLSLHDALPIFARCGASWPPTCARSWTKPNCRSYTSPIIATKRGRWAIAWCCWMLDASRRSEEHTSELQSRGHLVCRLLLEKKKKTQNEFYRE